MQVKDIMEFRGQVKEKLLHLKAALGSLKVANNETAKMFSTQSCFPSIQPHSVLRKEAQSMKSIHASAGFKGRLENIVEEPRSSKKVQQPFQNQTRVRALPAEVAHRWLKEPKLKVYYQKQLIHNFIK